MEIRWLDQPSKVAAIEMAGESIDIRRLSAKFQGRSMFNQRVNQIIHVCRESSRTCSVCNVVHMVHSSSSPACFPAAQASSIIHQRWTTRLPAVVDLLSALLLPTLHSLLLLDALLLALARAQTRLLPQIHTH